MGLWDDPVSTEGVEQANPPAAPSEEVVPAPETVAEKPVTEENPEAEKPTSPEGTEEQAKDEAATAEQGESITPVNREARKVFMEAQKYGGWDTVKEGADLLTALQNPELDTPAKLQQLHQAAPRQFEELKKEVFFSYWDKPEQQDFLISERFKATPEEIEHALSLAKGSQVAPSTEATDFSIDDDDFMSDASKATYTAMKARIEKLEAIEKRLPTLETQVSSLSEQKQQQQEDQIRAKGVEYVNQALSPVDVLLKEAGLEVLPNDPPAEKEWKELVCKTVREGAFTRVTTLPAYKPLADDVEYLLSKGDDAGANAKLKTMQARAELEGAKLLKTLLGDRQKQREAQASVLDQARPPMIQGGQTSLGSPQGLPTGRDTWNDGSEQERWKDIAAGLG